MYAGDTLRSAIYETIFHDVPITTKLKTIRLKEIQVRSHTELAIQKNMNLVSLRAPVLRNWGIRRGNLVATTAKLYGQTAIWAQAIHHTFPKAHGLVWTSNQCDPDSAYLFFGDRTGTTDFVTSPSRDGNTDKVFQSDVRKAGRLANIIITV